MSVSLLCALVLTLSAPADDATHQAARALGRGVNLGNCFEAPKPGEWGVTYQPEFPRLIKAAGFDHIRIPSKWSAHAGNEPPYTIAPEYFALLDQAVDQSLAAGLKVVLNIHHFDELDRDPESSRPKLLALWKQLAEHYRDRSQDLYFELNNEPHDKLTTAAWNAMLPAILKEVRATNPDRFVIIGPGMWNNVNELARLELPADDRRLIATFHYYEPFHFTHQGAEWAEGSDQWLGQTWTATPEQLKRLRDDFDKASRWAKDQSRPIYLGEFGAYQKAPLDSRVTWTNAIAREAEARGFAAAYWEFAAGFGVYDRQTKDWRAPLLKALIPTSQAAR